MSDNRDIYRQTMEQLLADTVTPAVVEACEQRIFPAALFTALEDNGITAMLAPEDQGGVAATLPEALAIARAAGAAAAPGPIVETMVAAALLARAGLDPVAGPVAIAFVGDEGAAALHDTPWGAGAGFVVVIGRVAEGASIAVTKAADWVADHGVDAAGEPRDTLTGSSLLAQSGIIVGAQAYAEALSLAALLRGGQILGALEWTLRRTVDYAMERRQFGRELGKFQVVQQSLAELADHVLAATAITQAAADSGAEMMIAAARSRLADASDAAIAIAHQTHGAMGFSREYPLNLRTRRLMAWRDDYGSVLDWRRRLAGGFTGLALEEVWPAVTAAGAN